MPGTMNGMSVKEDFDAAVPRMSTLPTKPSQGDQLKLYALYKQSTSGDASGKRPGITKMVERAKYDAWAALSGTSREDAMGQYIAFASSF